MVVKSATIHTSEDGVGNKPPDMDSHHFQHSKEGKRSNRVNTLARVHPAPSHCISPTLGQLVYLDHTLHRITLLEDRFDSPLNVNSRNTNAKSKRGSTSTNQQIDDVKTSAKNEIDDDSTFVLDDSCSAHAENSEIWNKVSKWYKQRLVTENAGHVSIVVTGASGSGKSHTLLGPSYDPGIIPRVCEDAVTTFGKNKEPRLYLSCFLLEGEDIIDLFAPWKGRMEDTNYRLFSSEKTNLASTLIDGLTTLVCAGGGNDTVASEARNWLSMACKAACVVIGQSDRCFYSVTFITRLIIVENDGDKKVRVINFVETESFGCADAASHADDRLSGASTRHQSTRLLRDAGRNIGRNGTLKQVQVNKSFLTFYLSQSVIIRPDCYIIGCIRPLVGTYDENFRTLDFMNRMDIMSEDDATIINVMSLNEILKELQNEINENEIIINQFAERKLQMEKKMLRKKKDIPETNNNLNMHIHTHTHSDLRDGYVAYTHKVSVLKNMKHILDSTNVKILSKESRQQTSHLKNWLELWGMTRVKKALWPTLKEISQTSYVPQLLNVAPGDYLVPLSSNGLPCFYGWIQITFGYTLISNMAWDSDYDELQARLHYGSCTHVLSPSLKSALGAAVHEDDDADDNEAFDRFYKGQIDNAPQKFKEGMDNELDDVDIDLFRTLFVYGDDIEIEHCLLQSVGGEIKMQSIIMENGSHSVVTRNGEIERGVCTLENGDYITFGQTQMFQLRKIIPQDLAATGGNSDSEDDPDDDPDDDDDDNESMNSKIKRLDYDPVAEAAAARRAVGDHHLTLYERACRRNMLSNLVDSYRTIASEHIHIKHMDTDRPINAIAKTIDKPYTPKSYNITREEAEDMVMDHIPPLVQSRLCEIQLASRAFSLLSIKMNRDCIARLVIKELSLDEYKRRMRYSGSLCYSVNGHYYSGEILIKILEGDQEIALWRWSRFVFIEHFFMCIRMYQKYKKILSDVEGNSKPLALQSLDNIYPTNEDPFLDIPGDGLIGVGYLYLDSLQYMLDIDENITLVNFKGRVSGQLRILVRVWIDKVTVEPSYVSADEEMKMDKYLDHTAHIRLHMSSLQGINASLCCKTHAEFKFFFHTKKYKTPQHAGYAPNPLINHTFSLHQKITPDFLDFLQNGSLEIEVWGKHVSPLSIKETKEPDSKYICRHLHMGDVKYTELIDSDEEKEVGGDSDSDDDTDDVDKLKAQIITLKEDLERAERKVMRSTKAVEAYEKKLGKGSLGGFFGGKKKGSNRFDDDDDMDDVGVNGEKGKRKKKKGGCTIA
jgi:hypothetical protein